MARYRRPTPLGFQSRPGLNQRTVDTWTTRYYQRKNDPMFDLLGMATATDDMHKKKGSSPYLQNWRYMGEREGEQRAQLMSRRGAQHLSTVGESIIIPEQSQATSYLEFYEGKAIQWQFSHNKRLSGIAVHLYNIGEATGFVRITIRDIDTGRELTQGAIDLTRVDIRGYRPHYVRFIKAIQQSRVTVRVEVMEDLTDDEDRSADRANRAVRILAQPNGTHSESYYGLPNTNESLQEEPYKFIEFPTAPLTGSSINDWQPMVRSQPVRIGGIDNIVFPVKHDGIIELFKTDLVTNLTSGLTTNVDPRSTAVRFDQAEGYLYYIDGYSPLRRINLTTLAVETVVPKLEEIQNYATADTDDKRNVLIRSVTAKAGASIILFLQNRLYLSGFKDDPNLVIYSLIDDTKPRFEQYNDRFYSPDQSPELSAPSPVTAFGKVNDVLIVWRIDGLSLYTPGAGIEINATQATPEGASLGVLNQEAVAYGKNNVYFYNAVEGVCRFAGSVNRGISLDIENELKRIKHPESIFMIYHNKRLRMYFSFTEERPDSCFYYYSDLEGQLPWYLDVNTPVSSAVPSKKTEDIIAIHSQVPSVMSVDKQFTDFDSYIECEYDTQYHAPSEIDGWTFVRRIHTHLISNSNHAMYIALDIDHRDQPIVYRRYVSRSSDPEINPDATFQHTAEDGIAVIDIPLYERCRTYQLRFKRFVYRDTAEILGASVEYSDKEPI